MNLNKKFLPERHSANDRALDEHERELSTKVTEVIKIPLNSAVYSFGAIKENARIRNEQDADPLLKALKQRIHTKNMTSTFSKLNHEDETYYATKKES